MKSKYQISYYMRILIAIIVYVVFFGYIIYSIINAKDTGSVIFNILMGLIFGGLGGLYEYLRLSYDAATKNLIFDVKPDKTLEKLNTIEKMDIFKTFKTSTQMMKVLAYTDLRQFDEVINYVKSIEQQGNDNYDVAITSQYGMMMAYGETGSKGKSNEAFKKLVSIRDQKDSKGRMHKGALFFNWEVVNGQHKNYDGDYQGAFHYLKDVDESKMNKRELMQYLLAKLVAAKNIKIKDVCDNCKERLEKIVVNNKNMKDYIDSI